MRLERLSLEHFRSHERLVLDLSGVEAAAIIGRNGAGKSTLLVAVDWVFFGGPGDELVTYGMRRGGVTLELHDRDGKPWRVSRTRERGKRTLLVVEQGTGSEDARWVPLKTNTLAEGQRHIDGFLRMGQDAFRATLYSPQGQAGLFAGMAAGDRKELLGGLLGLGRWEAWREQVAADERDVAGEVTGKRAVAGALRDAIEVIGRERLLADPDVTSRRLAVARETREGLDGELAAAIRRQSDAERVLRRRELQRAMDGLKAARDQRRALTGRIMALSAAVGDRQGLRAELERAEADRERQREAVAEASAAVRSYQQRLAERSERLERARQARKDAEAAALRARTRRQALARSAPQTPVEHLEECPTCGQAVRDAEARDRALAAVREAHARWEGELSLAIDVAGERDAALVAAMREVETAVMALDALGGPPAAPPAVDSRAWEAARKAVSDLGDDEARLRAMRQQLAADEEQESEEAMRARYDALKAERDRLPEAVEEGPTPGDVQQRIGEVDVTIGQLRVDLDRHAQAEADVAAKQRELEEVRQAIDGMDRRLAALAVTKRAFSRDGVPAMILDNAVEGIEEAANDALRRISDGVAVQSVRLATQTALKSGAGMKETLEILVDDGTFERPLATFSGGEAYRVHIALRMGLERVIAGEDGGLLLIDEPTDLDDAGLTMLAELLPRLGRQVLLISHDGEFVSGMPQTITVDRDAGASMVTIS